MYLSIFWSDLGKAVSVGIPVGYVGAGCLLSCLHCVAEVLSPTNKFNYLYQKAHSFLSSMSFEPKINR